MTNAVPTLHRAVVTRSWDETPTLRGLALAAPDLAGAHARPGQYVKVVAGPGAEGYFALANPPGPGELELLVKRGGAAADRLAALGPGATVDLTAPMGKGFPAGQHAGCDLLLFAAGSGIAPIRAVVRHVLARRDDYGRVRLYYGHRRPDEFAYTAEHPEWERGAIELIRVASAPDANWPGARGWVQHALRSAPPDLSRAVAYVSGMKPMVEGVTRTLAELGLPADRVFLNY